MFKVRASSLGRLMTDPKSKTEILSVGAKTFVEEAAKEFVYQFTRTFSSKETEKGQIVEPQAIELLNEVLFADFVKNAERRENDWITGECDIYTGSKVHDIKAPWSLATFPATVFAGRDKDYEWQLRAYMWLWDCDESEIDYCMVNTPDELIRFEDASLHYVDHIDATLRVTRVPYSRDKKLEELIAERVEAARKYFEQIVETITLEHAA